MPRCWTRPDLCMQFVGIGDPRHGNLSTELRSISWVELNFLCLPKTRFEQISVRLSDLLVSTGILKFSEACTTWSKRKPWDGDAGVRGRIYPRENASEFPVSIVPSDSIEACKIKAPAWDATVFDQLIERRAELFFNLRRLKLALPRSERFPRRLIWNHCSANVRQLFLWNRVPRGRIMLSIRALSGMHLQSRMAYPTFWPFRPAWFCPARQITGKLAIWIFNQLI